MGWTATVRAGGSYVDASGRQRFGTVVFVPSLPDAHLLPAGDIRTKATEVRLLIDEAKRLTTEANALEKTRSKVIRDFESKLADATIAGTKPPTDPTKALDEKVQDLRSRSSALYSKVNEPLGELGRLCMAEQGTMIESAKAQIAEGSAFLEAALDDMQATAKALNVQAAMLGWARGLRPNQLSPIGSGTELEAEVDAAARSIRQVLRKLDERAQFPNGRPRPAPVEVSLTG